MLTNLPNPTLFLDTIHLQEAKASSEIENIITTNDDLYKSLVADKKFDNPATKEVLSYKEALYNGLHDIEKRPFISTNLCIEIVQSIKKNTAGIREATEKVALFLKKGFLKRDLTSKCWIFFFDLMNNFRFFTVLKDLY